VQVGRDSAVALSTPCTVPLDSHCQHTAPATHANRARFTTPHVSATHHTLLQHTAHTALHPHLRGLEHVLNEVGHGGLQPVRHCHQHRHQPVAHGLAHGGRRVQGQREQALQEAAGGGWRGRRGRRGAVAMSAAWAGASAMSTAAPVPPPINHLPPLSSTSTSHPQPTCPCFPSRHWA
jgi:hypothetical protein